MRKFFLSLAVLLLFAGCAGSGSTYELSEMRVYENSDLGIRFSYPAYYSEPELTYTTGETGEIYNLRFLYEYKEDDPYVVYFNGSTSNYVSNQLQVRVPYKGDYMSENFCAGEEALIPFVDEVGDSCELINFGDEGQYTGALENLAILDIVNSTIEKVFFANYSEGYPYAGLQVGFRIPQDYVKFRTFAKAELRGDTSVSDIINRMDSGHLPDNLVEELDRFKVMLESIEFIATN